MSSPVNCATMKSKREEVQVDALSNSPPPPYSPLLPSAPNQPLPQALTALKKTCKECSAPFPPENVRFHHITPNLYCFYVEHTEKRGCSNRPQKFLMSVYMRQSYPEGRYCVQCFQKAAMKQAQGEANNVCLCHDIARLEDVICIR